MRQEGSELYVLAEGWLSGSWRTSACSDMHMHINHETQTETFNVHTLSKRQSVCVYLSRLRGITPGDSEAGAVSASVTGVVAVVTGVVAVVVSSSEELMKEVLLEADGEVVTGV